MADLGQFLRSLATGQVNLGDTGLANLAEVPLNLPGAVLTGTRDVLGGQGVGDRPAVEQLLRVLGGAAALNAGVGPFLAVQEAYAQGDQQRAATVQSAAFQRAFRAAEARALQRGATPEEAQAEALRATRQLFPASSGFRPQGFQAVDGPALDDSGLPTPSIARVSVLPGLPAGEHLEDIKQQTQLGAVTGPVRTEAGRLQQLRARYELAGLTPPLTLQTAEAGLLGAKREGQQAETLQLKNGELSLTRKDLPFEETFYPRDAIGQAEADLDIALFNRDAARAGLPQRAVKVHGPSGIGVKFLEDPFQRSLSSGAGTAAVSDFAATMDPRFLDAFRGLVSDHFQGADPAAGDAPAVLGGPDADLSPTMGPLKGREQREEERRDRARQKQSETPTPAQREAFAQTERLSAAITDLRTSFEQAEQERLTGTVGATIESITGGQPTGPLAGRLKRFLARNTGWATPGVRDLVVNEARVKNAYIKAITGAQLSREEAVRIGQQLALMETHPDQFLAALDKLEDDIGSLTTARGEQFPSLTAEDTEVVRRALGWEDAATLTAIAAGGAGDDVTVLETEDGTITFEQ